jgi:hypothetical protein
MQVMTTTLPTATAVTEVIDTLITELLADGTDNAALLRRSRAQRNTNELVHAVLAAGGVSEDICIEARAALQMGAWKGVTKHAELATNTLHHVLMWAACGEVQRAAAELGRVLGVL